jgi:hypothetical protein
MTSFTDLPPEVLREIVFQALLADQAVPSSQKAGNKVHDGSPTTEHNPQAVSANSLQKIFTGSFIQGREVMHAIDTDHMYSDSEWYLDCVNSRIKRKSLLALSQTCWELNRIVEPVLWEIVEMYGEMYVNDNPIQELLYSIFKRPQRAKYTRAISLRRDRDFWDIVDKEAGGPPWKLLVNQPERFKNATERAAALIALENRTETDIQQFLDSCPASIQWALIWFLMPNIRTANFPQCLPSFWERFIDTQNITSLKFPPGLQYLEEFSLSCILEDGRCTPNFLLPIFLLPNLRTLYFDHFMTYDYAENWNLIRHPQSSYMGKSAILSLDFEMCVLLQDTLRILLKIPRALQSFTWTWGRSFNRLPGEGAEGLLTALEAQAESLKKIHFRGPPDGRAEDFTIVGNAFALGFPMLEELGMPISLLLFDRGKGYPMPRVDTPQRTLASTLPPSLIKLRLYVYDEWLYSNWEKELRELIEKKSKFTPKLAYVWIEYWISAEEDKRPSSEVDGEERARKVEEITSSFQDLIEEADEAGIKLEVFLGGAGRSFYR